MSIFSNRTARQSARTVLTAAAFFFVLALVAFPTAAETDRYRLSWRDDPSTTVAIGWDQVTGERPVVYWGEVDQGDDHDAYPNQSSPDVVQHYRGMHNHFVRLTGLQPDTAYYFIIKDSESTSRRMWFRTAPDQPQPFSFVAGGDSRSNTPPRQEGNRLIAKLRPLSSSATAGTTWARAPPSSGSSGSTTGSSPSPRTAASTRSSLRTATTKTVTWRWSTDSSICLAPRCTTRSMSAARCFGSIPSTPRSPRTAPPGRRSAPG